MRVPQNFVGMTKLLELVLRFELFYGNHSGVAAKLRRTSPGRRVSMPSAWSRIQPFAAPTSLMAWSTRAAWACHRAPL